MNNDTHIQMVIVLSVAAKCVYFKYNYTMIFTNQWLKTYTCDQKAENKKQKMDNQVISMYNQ